MTCSLDNSVPVYRVPYVLGVGIALMILCRLVTVQKAGFDGLMRRVKEQDEVMAQYNEQLDVRATSTSSTWHLSIAALALVRFALSGESCLAVLFLTPSDEVYRSCFEKF